MMHLVTQISSSNNVRAKELAEVLSRQQVATREVSKTNSERTWSAYEQAAHSFDAIRDVSFLTINNAHGPITKELALHIAYALLVSKPIMLQELPAFSDEVDTFLQRIIGARLHHFAVCNLTKRGCSPQEVRSALRHLATAQGVDYALNTHDIILIQSKIRSYLRECINQPLESVFAPVATQGLQQASLPTARAIALA
ncbi:MAG TPA: hypothetical protein VFI74_04640 [Candidatus Saccharimonadales bacterium]|nr:hypothetical protein [Candidatus Saccharimonadales bacterium]